MNSAIIIGFSKNRFDKIGSKALQWYMKKDYSHVFIIIDNLVYHSSMSSGVEVITIDKFLKDNIMVSEYLMSVDSRKIKNEFNNHIGHRYAFMQNLGIVIVDFFKTLGVKITNPFRQGDNCSELVYEMLLEVHPDIKDFGYSKDTIRPDHIESIINKLI